MVSSLAPVADGKWHQITIVVAYGDSSGNFVKLYVDGVLNGVDGNDLTEKTLAPCGAAIGYGPGAEFHMDDVLIWNRAISSGEIYELAMSRGGFSAQFNMGLTARYRFEEFEDEGGDVVDSSGNGNTATATSSENGAVLTRASSGTLLWTRFHLHTRSHRLQKGAP